jgi:hypothetical protein
MDYRERFADPEELQRLAMEAHQSGVWTALPGIIVSFNPANATAVVQPAIKATVASPDFTTKQVPRALCADVPVVFPHGGGFHLTFPVSPGDECLLIFSARCIDAWWQSGGVQAAAHPRMHSLSDAFAILGPLSRPNVPGGSAPMPLVKERAAGALEAHASAHTSGAGIHTNAVQLRSTSGAVSISLEASSATITAPVTTVSGNLSIGTGATGTFTAASGETVTVQDGVIINIF